MWRDIYRSEDDPYAINYGKEYSELYFTHKIYNYVIHPQWDSFGSETLFYKQLYTDYDSKFVIIELIGEWNDCINNDIMYLKTELIEPLQLAGIENFVLVMENVLNFHGSDTEYYEEWFEETDGEIYMVNILPQVLDELYTMQIHNYIVFDGPFNEIDWRVLKPEKILNHLRTSLEQEEF